MTMFIVRYGELGVVEVPNIIIIIVIINMITIMMFIVRYGELGVVEVPNCNGTNLLSRPNLRLRLILIMMIIV